MKNSISREVEVIEHLNRVVKRYATENIATHPARAYFEPISSLSDGLPVPIFGVMLLIWQLRDQDLQTLYPLDTVESRMRFLSWCICSGVKEYALLRECEPFWEELSKPAYDHQKYSTLDSAQAISWLMVITLISRPDVNCDLTSSHGRAKLLLWYLQYGFEPEYNGTRLGSWQIDFLLTKQPSGITNHQHILFEARNDLKESFNLPSEISRFTQWYSESAEFKSFIAAVSRSTEYNTCLIRPKAAGVNVVGYLSETSGIAEDSRMMIAALNHTTIPTVAVDYSKNVSPRDNHHRNKINVFCFPVLEHARYIAEHGLTKVTGHYNIGYWPWEISHWPSQWSHLFSLVDEVWASSAYTQNSILSSTTKPVLFMPMAVEVASTRRLTRKNFGLPEHKFLFYFAFDLKSSSRRKNPEACISAFLKAFPTSDKVGLVIKVLKPSTTNKEWSALEKLAQKDKRIYIICETLERGDLIDLYAACDCFISLHRAEGFGRNIAEAMILGKPVVVTDYSGNQSFATIENSLPVDYKLIRIEVGDYPHVTNGTWAEPNTNSAATAMKTIFSDQELSNKLRRSARLSMINHSTFNVAKNYLARIDYLASTFEDSKEGIYDLV
ncbi:glycosyltransferase [Massilia oculi]|uniref:glycosyltransferase n=1 Tax=Massilia oculi TaxID=945844 RepID=UPI001AAEA0BF|nr:glycosyltransferase [Massilia oculi]